jgi:type 1 fimbriae regulatory protein FimB/type 1 fimbriae regulatory protein FimE
MRSNVVQVSFSGQTKNFVPTKPKNKEVREREYLTAEEVENLVKAVKPNRQALRDEVLIKIMFHHGLRVSEAINLKWSEIELDRQRIHVKRVKNGDASVQPVSGKMLRLLRLLKRSCKSGYVFESSTGNPLTTAGVFKMIRRAGAEVGMPYVHPHMLRHACGFALANAGQDTRAIQGYLGHRNIQHTVKYTQLAENRFDGFERVFE